MFIFKMNIKTVIGVLSLLAIPLTGHAYQSGQSGVNWYSSAEEIKEYLTTHDCSILAKIQDDKETKTYTRQLNSEIEKKGFGSSKSEVYTQYGTGADSEGDATNEDGTRRGGITVYQPSKDVAGNLGFWERGNEPEFTIRFSINKLVGSVAYIYTDDTFVEIPAELRGASTDGVIIGNFNVNRDESKIYTLQCILKSKTSQVQ